MLIKKAKCLSGAVEYSYLIKTVILYLNKLSMSSVLRQQIRRLEFWILGHWVTGANTRDAVTSSKQKSFSTTLWFRMWRFVENAYLSAQRFPILKIVLHKFCEWINKIYRNDVHHGKYYDQKDPNGFSEISLSIASICKTSNIRGRPELL